MIGPKMWRFLKILFCDITNIAGIALPPSQFFNTKYENT